MCVIVSKHEISSRQVCLFVLITYVIAKVAFLAGYLHLPPPLNMNADSEYILFLVIWPIHVGVQGHWTQG